MKSVNFSKLVTVIPLRAALLATAFSISAAPPAYSQQEVDPTWFNPWSEPERETSPHAHTTQAKQKPARKISTVSSARPQSKHDGKQQITSTSQRHVNAASRHSLRRLARSRALGPEKVSP